MQNSRGKNNIRAAFFDLDHTLLKTNSSFRFGAYLYKKKFFSYSTLARLVWYYWRHKTFGLSIAELHYKTFRYLFFGRLRSLFCYHSNQFVNEHFTNLLYLPAYTRLKSRQQEGAHTVILSNSPDFLVEPFARAFGVDEWRGSVYGVDKDERLCTISSLMHGNEKARFVEEWAIRANIHRNCLEAYSDSLLDISFLEAAGNPIIVNPERKLRQIGKNRQWEML